MGPVIHGHQRVELMSHGKTVAEIVPVKTTYDRKKAWAVLRKFAESGPLEIAPRK